MPRFAPLTARRRRCLRGRKGRLIRCTVPGSTPNCFAMNTDRGKSATRFNEPLGDNDRPPQWTILDRKINSSWRRQFYAQIPGCRVYGPLSQSPNVRHGNAGDTGDYPSEEVAQMAHSLAVRLKSHPGGLGSS